MAQRITHRGSADGGWTIAAAQPDARLAPFVRGYTEWSDVRHSGTRRVRHGPAADVPMIINIGHPLGTVDRAGDGSAVYRRAFVAGLHRSYAVTESDGASGGIQVDLTPIGAHLLFGVPMHEVTDRTVDLEDVLGADGRRLIEQLEVTVDAEARFAIIDAAIAAGVARARAPSEGVLWAWRALERSGGRANISTLTERLGCSRRHLVAQFREQIGLPPKVLARVLRFNAAVDAARGAERPNWSAIAAAAGYYDQAHLVRDFIEFAGATPGEYARRRDPDTSDLRDA